jgi:hypothetical protein
MTVLRTKAAMDAILSAVSDCSGVIALRTGDTPARKLESLGIAVISAYDRIEDAVLKAYNAPFASNTTSPAADKQQKKEIC